MCSHLNKIIFNFFSFDQKSEREKNLIVIFFFFSNIFVVGIVFLLLHIVFLQFHQLIFIHLIICFFYVLLFSIFYILFYSIHFETFSDYYFSFSSKKKSFVIFILQKKNISLIHRTQFALRTTNISYFHAENCYISCLIS